MNQTGSEWEEPPKVPVLDSPTNCSEGTHPSWLFASNTRHVLAVVSRLDATGVRMISRWAEQGREVAIRMVVLVHATCPTRSEDLAALVALAESHPGKLKFLVRPHSHWGEELTWVRLDYVANASMPLLWMASAGNFGLSPPESHNGHVVLSPDAGMDEQFVLWYSAVEAKAVPLDQHTAQIPALVPAQGTMEGRQIWEAYLERFTADAGTNANGSEVATGGSESPTDDGATPTKKSAEEIAEEVRKDTGLPTLDPIVPLVSRLFQCGCHVTLDKGSRIPPLGVPINARFFGIDRVRQRGVISRRVEYDLSILDEQVNTELENYRKAPSQLLPKFTFALADGNRWMPMAAKELYEGELKRVEASGSEMLRGIVGGDTKAFVASKRDVVVKAAQEHYHEFHPGAPIPEEFIDKILEALEVRFAKALTCKFVPVLSEVGTNFRAPRDGDSGANWAGARRLIVSVAEYPRKAIKDHAAFFRDLKVEPEELLDAMNVLGDEITHQARDRRAKQIAKDQLACLEAIEQSALSDRDKCAEIIALMQKKKTIWEIRKTLQESGS